MGFFSGFVHTFQKVGKAINKGFARPAGRVFASIPKLKALNVVANVAKYGPVPGVVQSLLEKNAPKIGAIHGAVLDTTFKVGASIALSPEGAKLASTALDTVNALKPQASGGQPMAFNIGGFLGGVSGILSKSSLPIFQNIGTAVGLASNFIPQPSGRPPGASSIAPSGLVAGPMPAMAAAGPAIAASRGIVSRSLFARFPNLATAIQQYKNSGRANITRAKLYAGLKRFGPDLLISGGILSAAAVSELAIAGPGRRRMNPANVKALRRSIRRLESFHHLCQKADKLRRPTRRIKHA